MRLEGYTGPIDLAVEGLPPGLKATANSIAAGQDSATILLSADAGAKLDQATPLAVTGKAAINGKTIAREANPEDRTKLIALAPAPDVRMRTLTKVIELEPGQSAEVKVAVTRQNGFAGRVPVEVRDLPLRVRVADSGLNGVLLNEDETERGFTLLALPNAAPVEGYIYLSGRVETRSPQQSSYAAPEPVLVRVKAPRTVAQAQ
jgi:hypothetical protein